MIGLGESVKSVLNRFTQNGFFACVGGETVRDLLMNNIPPSYIILTDAPKEFVKTVFKGAALSRKNSISVIEDKNVFEIYCSRNKDNERELLSGLDFTVNSIGYSHIQGLIDPFGAIKDLEEKQIRFTGEVTKNPELMLKAVRYCALFGFEISDEAQRLIKKYSPLAKYIRSDIIREELEKILMSDNPKHIMTLQKLGLLKYIMPELDICFGIEQRNKYHIYNVGEHIVNAVCAVANDLTLRWAALLHDIGKPECKSTDSNGVIHFYGHHKASSRIANEILRRFKIDGKMIKDITVLIENHDVRIEPTLPEVKQMMSRTGTELFLKLVDLQEADNRAKNPKYFADKQGKLNEVRAIYRTVISERQPYRIADLAIGARDLSRLGFRTGYEISHTLRKLLDEVLIDPELNRYEYLIMRAKYYKKTNAFKGL